MQAKTQNPPLLFPTPPHPSTAKEYKESISPPRNPEAIVSQTGDDEKAIPLKKSIERQPILTSLDSLNEMEKVQAIGELSQLNTQLEAFVRDEILSFDSKNTPPTQKELQDKWNKINPPACNSSDIQIWAEREILKKLDQTQITLARNHDLTRIDEARKNWNLQMEQARSNADEDSVLHWEQLGKGIFYPKQEEARQREISRRFSDYKTIREQMNTQPARVLEYLQTPSPGEDIPPSVKSYWVTQARKNLAAKQENFYKMLIENELKGTPYREDLLEQAERQQLISTERKKAYLERFTEERPLRNEASLSLPFMNSLYELISTYSPAQDVRGERKRSVYALIAESDCEQEEKGNLIRQFAHQRNNPDLALLRNKATAYLQERYERDGFGEFSARPIPTDAQTEEELHHSLAKNSEKSWLASEKKWAAAQKALNDYLEERKDNLPVAREWQELLPQILYKTTRTPRRLFSEDNSTFHGYPILVENPSNVPISADLQEKNAPSTPKQAKQDRSSPQTWQETLNRYFSEHPDISPKIIRNDMKRLYSQWINRKKTVHSLDMTALTPRKNSPI